MEIFLGAFATEWQQRRAAFLHDLSLGRRRVPDDDERRRRGGSVATPGAAGKRTRFSSGTANLTSAGRAAGQRSADRPMRARFAGLASGSQPTVVKMASFSGGGRLGAMINYVSRNGAVVVENERGDQLRGRDQLSTVATEWDHLLKNRTESRDIGQFKIAVEDRLIDSRNLLERARTIVKDGLGDRAFAIAVSERPDGSGFDIDGVTVLRSGQGERLTADAKATDIVQGRIDKGQNGASGTDFQFTGYGNGTDYGTSRLRSLVEKHEGAVQDQEGRAIADGKRAGDLVQQDWRNQLHSRKPRDVMHLILSARAGTDAVAFQDAARDFLGSQFANHRYVFSLHEVSSDPKAEDAGGKRPHVHVHAIVAMRSDAGDRLETTIATFRQWRLNMAEKARAQGLNMEMTDRRDRASPASYSKNKVRPMNMIGRTQHEGTSDGAQSRYDAKRRDEPSPATTTSGQAYMLAARREWQDQSNTRLSRLSQDFATAQLMRLNEGRAPAEQGVAAYGEQPNTGSQFRSHLVRLAALVSETDDMRHMTRPEFEAYEKRVEAALFQAGRVMPPEERKDFEEIAAAARDHVNVRRELVKVTEERTAPGIADQRISEAPREERDNGHEVDDELKTALQAIERERQSTERERTGRVGPRDPMPHQRSDASTRPREPTTEARQPQSDSEPQRRDDPDEQTGDTSRSDPARQHVPRLEEMEREAEQRHQRERDERER
ncbi:conjugal transfer protein TraA [Rhizobium tubonense]|uniref:Conjugal transfer protein TraA n=1 Tax=Rhizobium tubonense TaxID=484088 RepID=A0A2W4ET74_9HYPH|nr:conjugal transfer protein TraA [Rhizobium tubonense]PZM16486.1 conjugal transfer protein TraA [Rhizobium tubonense]